MPAPPAPIRGCDHGRRGDHGSAETAVAPAPQPNRRRASDASPPRPDVAFISGLTSLGYQVTWTRLLASGTGNTTYVFTMILGTFLVGPRHRGRCCSPSCARGWRPGPAPRRQPARGRLRWRSSGSSSSSSRPRCRRPTSRLRRSRSSFDARSGRAAGHDRPRCRVPGVVRAPARRRRSRRRRLGLAAGGEHGRGDRRQPGRALRAHPAARLAGPRRGLAQPTRRSRSSSVAGSAGARAMACGRSSIAALGVVRPRCHLGRHRPPPGVLVQPSVAGIESAAARSSPPPRTRSPRSRPARSRRPRSCGSPARR